MNNKTEPLIIPSLMRLAQKIARSHKEAKMHATINIIYTLRCGFYCHQAKGKLPHGQLQKWAEDNITGITKKTPCENYIKLYLKVKSLSRELSDLIEHPELMTQIQCPCFVADFGYQIQEFFDGASITELYSQYGITEDNKQPELAAVNY